MFQIHHSMNNMWKVFNIIVFAAMFFVLFRLPTGRIQMGMLTKMPDDFFGPYDY